MRILCVHWHITYTTQHNSNIHLHEFVASLTIIWFHSSWRAISVFTYKWAVMCDLRCDRVRWSYAHSLHVFGISDKSLLIWIFCLTPYVKHIKVPIYSSCRVFGKPNHKITFTNFDALFYSRLVNSLWVSFLSMNLCMTLPKKNGWSSFAFIDIGTFSIWHIQTITPANTLHVSHRYYQIAWTLYTYVT